MRATFHNKGNSCFEIHVFIMCVRGDAKCSVTSLINLVGILSEPVEQSDRNPLIKFLKFISFIKFKICYLLKVENVKRLVYCRNT